MARKVQYKFDPFKLTGETRRGMTKKSQDEALKEIADMVLKKVEGRLDESSSPVSGQGRFRNLKSGGSSILRESGDMRDSQRVKRDGGNLVHTVLKSEQPKADNHNKFSAASGRTEVPRRQFIPNRGREETYKKDIIDAMKKIIREKKDGSGNN
jgi:hypothetical protein